MEEQEEVWSENRKKVKTENLCFPLTEWETAGQAPQGSCIHSPTTGPLETRPSSPRDKNHGFGRDAPSIVMK